MELKSRILPGVLIGGVVLAGGGSVIAASGGSSSTSSAASTQYCQDGAPKPANGDCAGGHPSGPPEKPGKHKKRKKPKFFVHRHPRTGCVARTFAARIGVSNKPARAKVYVYRDGRRIMVTTRSAFKVHFAVRGMSRRRLHYVSLRVRGANGKWVTATVRFRTC